MEAGNLEDVGQFDSVFMLESLEHVLDKKRVLAALTRIARRLVLIVNCDRQPFSPVSTFGGTVFMTSPETLLRTVEEAGWQVRTEMDTRAVSVPTIRHWKARIEENCPGKVKEPIEILHQFCVIALAYVEAFLERFPLLTIYAECE
jgi:hypothetical protein